MAIKQRPDSPTNNFAVCNVNYAHSSATISNGALSITGSSSFAISTIAVTSGIWYFECHVLSTNGSHISVAELDLITHAQLFDAGNNSNAYGYYATGKKSRNGTFTDYGNSHSSGDILGCCFDLDSGKIYFSLNGSWVNGNSSSYSNLSSIIEAFSGLSGTIAPRIGHYNNDQATTFNAGQDPTFGGNKNTPATVNGVTGPFPPSGIAAGTAGLFYYPPPTDALALCSANLPEMTPTVDDDVPQDYFKAVTYAGNESGGVSEDLGFTPDMIWVKASNINYSHVLIDSLRPHSDANSYYRLHTDTTNPEADYNDNIYITNNGFNCSSQQSGVNENNINYVAWCWKAAGAPDQDYASANDGSAKIINEDGTANTSIQDCAALATAAGASITPIKVSANRQNGFSIVKYEGVSPTSSSTLPHGLSKTPEFVIIKGLSGSGTTSTGGSFDMSSGSGWFVNHVSTGLEYSRLDDTASSATSANVFKGVGPSYITIGIDSWLNCSGVDYIAYCWHSVEGYSKFGSYTGNGSTDGPFVYCGFRPAFVICKVYNYTSSYASWAMFDNARDSSNVMNKVLYANKSINEGYRGDASTAATDIYIDFLSNGFKLRSIQLEHNANGDGIIFMAFAEQPFNYANAR